MFTVVDKSKKHSLCIHDRGLADYREVLQLQHELRDKRRNKEIPDTILITEHHPVITLGARQNANQLLVSRVELEREGIDVVEIRRGGGVTAHNPGQLVFYPIVNLQGLGLGISEYIRELEAIGIELLKQLGVRSHRRKGYPGLWIGEKKIASVGVRVSKFVTFHGMAINIQNDLGIFDFIVPCGLDDIKMTSVLKETGKRHPMNQIKEKLSQLLFKHLSESNKSRTTNHQSRVTNSEGRRLPHWLKRPLPAGKEFEKTNRILNSLGIQTICDNANCPNRGDCWNRGTATVLILGNVCTRNCRFCSVATGRPILPDPAEPGRIAELAKLMKLKYLVITSVNRDDLTDGGASHFRDCINEARRQCPDVKFEILTPDFRNCQEKAIKILGQALPFVFAHNIETVPPLYPIARAGGAYQRSLRLLKMAGQYFENTPIKSSIMLGLGETDEQIEQGLRDLHSAGCERITIGQYLKPSKNSLDVVEYVRPEKFDFWKEKAIEIGFSWVFSAPFARSSYFAEQQAGIRQ